MDRSRPCRGRPEEELGNLATGLAIRRGIAYRRNGDLKTLGRKTAFQSWGADITVTESGRKLRFLSVHLASCCWGEREDRKRGRREICAILRAQMLHLKAWADARRAEGAAFVMPGDFNRRLALPEDWA